MSDSNKEPNADMPDLDDADLDEMDPTDDMDPTNGRDVDQDAAEDAATKGKTELDRGKSKRPEKSDADSGRQIEGGPRVPRSGFSRLVNGMTAIDFVGRRRFGFALSTILIIATFVSLGVQGLNLGIDFEGGVSWEVPAANGFTEADAQRVLTDNGIDADAARIQTRSIVTVDANVPDDEYIKVQVSDQPVETGDELRPTFAEAGGVPVDDVNVSLVSAAWGEQITNKAIRALVIFLIVVAIFISVRFEWRMALSAIAAMAHDVVISVGIYSIFQFSVSPATVIAFLTILGYSLYDTIVVFDRVRENEVRFETKRVSYDDIINVSMNQVLMRSLTTSFSSIVPVSALLVIGAGIMGVSALSDFAIALLVGMVTGAYSSILVASPLLGLMKRRDPLWAGKASLGRVTGEPLRAMVVSGAVPSRRRSTEVGPSDGSHEEDDEAGTLSVTELTAEEVLQHKPRPRRKTRR